MLDALRFTMGAVAKKDLVPSLTHFCIKDGTIRGYNGTISLCSPIDLDLETHPKALPFIKAIQTCKEEVSLSMTKGGRLAVKSGKFRAYIENVAGEDYPEFEPEGETVEVPRDFLNVVKTVAPFIAEDASRPWAMGILFREQSAYATNNIIIVEHWLGVPFPIEINVPRSAVKELLRINEVPETIQVTDKSITFHYEGQRWLRAPLYTTQWPDLDRVFGLQGAPVELPDGFFSQLEEVLPFTDELDRVYFNNSTFETVYNEELGASVDCDSMFQKGCFNIKQLLLLKSIVKRIDFSMYPKPCLFYGNNLRGAVIGMTI